MVFWRATGPPLALFSFHPETTLFRCGGANLRVFLCGVKHYTSTQMLDFLDLAKKFWFPDQKRYSTPPEFPDGNYLENAACYAE